MTRGRRGAAVLRAALVAVALSAAGLAHAAFPAAYRPLVVEPEGRPQRWTFDLTPAFERARREGKRLYVYLGAENCGYCRRYEAFLTKNVDALKPHFDKDWVVVDLRSHLDATAGKLEIRIGERTLGYRAFQESIGDERARMLIYPLVWVLDSAGRPLMPMPSGAGTFETVGEQLEILRLVQ